MTPDELRALADALEPMAKAPRFEDFDVPAFCAWVRAQADAQPVAWIARNLTTGRVKWTTDRCRARGWTRDANLRVKLLYAHPAPAVPAGWQLVPVNPTPEMLASTSWPGCAGTDYAHMLAAAPAAPQAEPIDPHMIVADDRFPDEQAGPKREPSCLWSRADDDTDMWETKCGHAFTIIDGTPTDNQMAFCCYCGRRVDEEIGGSDE